HYDVFSDVGACLPRRDSVDERIIDQAKKKTGRIINSQSEVGGWPKLESQPAPPDRDHDGMPDKWEERMGFNPDDSADGTADSDGDGYTNLEEYLQEKCVGLDHTVIEGDKFAFDWGPPGPPFKGTRDEFLNASKDLSIRLSSDKTIYRIGEPVFANLEFTNDSGYPFWIHPVQASINNPLEIVDPSGKKAVWKGESVSSVDSESPVLAQETVTVFSDFNCSKEYDLSKPGKYKMRFTSGLRVSFRDETGKSGGLQPDHLKSNWVEFEIVPRK
ncbi:MAG: hypothetical protein KC940_09615, partial [Candidatus Omnitrophica bacterium]|nr:hypothetical protein [Candidatus Omnitrophota bacterium]